MDFIEAYQREVELEKSTIWVLSLCKKSEGFRSGIHINAISTRWAKFLVEQNASPELNLYQVKKLVDDFLSWWEEKDPKLFVDRDLEADVTQYVLDYAWRYKLAERKILDPVCQSVAACRLMIPEMRDAWHQAVGHFHKHHLESKEMLSDYFNTDVLPLILEIQDRVFLSLPTINGFELRKPEGGDLKCLNN